MKAEAYSPYKQKLEIPVQLPDFVADSVLDIDFTQLYAVGIKHLLFDLDATLRRRRSKALEPEVIAHLTKLPGKVSFSSINLVSNNWRNYTYNLRSLKRYSIPLKAHVFRPYFERGRLVRKPSPRFFQHVLRELQAKPNETVMIGDKLRADIIGANKAGLYTIYVKRYGKDNLYDRVMLTRYRETKLLKKVRATLDKLSNP